jgi:hypothetical protein
MGVRMTDEWLDLALKEAGEAYRRGDWPVAVTRRAMPEGLAIAMDTARARKTRRLVRTAEYLRWVFVRSTDQIEARREWLTVSGGNSSHLRRVEQETLVSRGRDTAREGPTL